MVDFYEHGSHFVDYGGFKSCYIKRDCKWIGLHKTGSMSSDLCIDSNQPVLSRILK